MFLKQLRNSLQASRTPVSFGHGGSQQFETSCPRGAHVGACVRRCVILVLPFHRSRCAARFQAKLVTRYSVCCNLTRTLVPTSGGDKTLGRTTEVLLGSDSTPDLVARRDQGEQLAIDVLITGNPEPVRLLSSPNLLAYQKASRYQNHPGELRLGGYPFIPLSHPSVVA